MSKNTSDDNKEPGHIESNGSSDGTDNQPKLTLTQIAQRQLGPQASDRPKSALSPETVRENISFVSPEHLVDDESVPLGTVLLRLREGVLSMVSSNHEMKRRYIWSAYKLALRYKADDRAAIDLRDFVATHTSLKIPKTIEPGSLQILEIMLKFQFVFTKYATQNTVTRWLNGLAHYFAHETDKERVKRLILVYGPESLYRHSVDRRKFDDRQAFLTNANVPIFREIDEVPPPNAPLQEDADCEVGDKNFEKPAAQQDDFDLPPADLDEQRGEIAEDDAEGEDVDIDAVCDAVNEGIILSMELGSAIFAKENSISREGLAVMAIHLSQHLVELRGLMTVKLAVPRIEL